jgi:TatD DNase family protein
MRDSDQSDATLCDTHAHLCDETFGRDLSEVLDRAAASGVGSVITVGETLEDARRNLELASKHDRLRPAAGLYPTHLDIEQAEAVIRLIRKERARLFALGEVGLDYWKVKGEAERALQREIFSRFIELSKELDLPLNVHSRSAGRAVIGLLLEKQAQRVQLHAFDGKASSALPAVEAGYFFSIPPSVTRSVQKQKLVKRLPLSSLLVETDSPVLGPVPGERNEPANATVVIEAIAEIKGISRREVAVAVSHNTVRLYGRGVF